MLRSLKNLEGYAVAATDGEIGKVVDFLLDDVGWAIRALVVRTSFLERRKVLISPISFRRPDWDLRQFNVALTIDKVERSPGIDVDKPVSRQHERDYYGYYGYPAYWGYVGMGITPGALSQASTSPPLAGNSDGSPADVHLRSASELRGYHIEGTDKAIGHVAYTGHRDHSFRRMPITCFAAWRSLGSAHRDRSEATSLRVWVGVNVLGAGAA